MHTVDLPVSLELGVMSDQVTVTSNRSEREVRQIPLHVETMSRAGIEQSNTLSTGDALAGAVEHQRRSATGRSSCARACAASIRRACWCSSTASA